MKKILPAIASTIAALSLVTTGNAAVNSVGDPGRSWSQPDDGARGLHIQQFSDSTPFGPATALLNQDKLSDNQLDPTCDSVDDPKCAGGHLGYTAVIPRCVSPSDVNCVSDLGTIEANGVKTSGEFQRYLPAKAQNEFKGDVSRGVPNGTSGGIYVLKNAVHDGGNTYYAAVTLKASIGPDGKSSRPGFDVKLFPVQIEPLGYQSDSTDEAGYTKHVNNVTGKLEWGSQAAGFNGTQFCVAVSMREKLCAEKYAFPADLRYYVEVKLSQLPTGWMHGRIDSPEIQISTQANYSVLTIQGAPVAVPLVYKVYKYPEMPEELKKWYSVEKGGYIPTCPAQATYCAGGRSGASSDPLNRNVIISPSPSSAEGMEQLRLWLPFVGDKATALPSYWSVRTLEGNEMEGASQCFADNSKITGIVTTNATQYSAGPPSFLKSEGTLNYKVASPHFGTNGDVFKGTYDLVMRSEVARCIYGFSKAPIQATLAITSADGTPQIATTVIGERDGWLYLRAKNFEFSAPTVKVKLSQEAEKVQEASPSTATPTVQKSSIVCIKGKTTKKVTAVNPKCPAGYKKKA